MTLPWGTTDAGSSIWLTVKLVKYMRDIQHVLNCKDCSTGDGSISSFVPILLTCPIFILVQDSNLIFFWTLVFCSPAQIGAVLYSYLGYGYIGGNWLENSSKNPSFIEALALFLCCLWFSVSLWRSTRMSCSAGWQRWSFNCLWEISLACPLYKTLKY